MQLRFFIGWFRGLKYGHSHALFSKALKECKCTMWVKLMLMVKAITSAVCMHMLTVFFNRLSECIWVRFYILTSIQVSQWMSWIMHVSTGLKLHQICAGQYIYTSEQLFRTNSMGEHCEVNSVHAWANGTACGPRHQFLPTASAHKKATGSSICAAIWLMICTIRPPLRNA